MVELHQELGVNINLKKFKEVIHHISVIKRNVNIQKLKKKPHIANCISHLVITEVRIFSQHKKKVREKEIIKIALHVQRLVMNKVNN